jgi:hypothetical protein
MRLKWLRDGVDDYDYIQLLKAAGQTSWLSQVISEVAVGWTNWTKDSQVLEGARIQMGEKLDALNNQAGESAPPVANPPSTPVQPPCQCSPVTAAKQYQVYFGDSPTTMSLWGTIVAPKVLNPATTYYWKIVPISSGGSQ